MAKTIILNQATLHPDYQGVDNKGKETWGSIINPDVRIIHYYGKYDSNGELTTKFDTLPEDGECLLYDENTLIIGTYDNNYPSDHPRHSIIPDARNEKLILALEYCINNFEFDYLLRICNTTYVDVNKMADYFDALPRTKVYDGARNLYNYETFFVAGHSAYMSHDVVDLLVQHKEDYLASSYPEDLATGQIIIHDLEYTSFDYLDTKYNYHPSHFFVTTETPETISLHSNPSIFCYRIQHRLDIFDRVHELVLEKDNA
jgi:hypothetical protein